MKNVLELIVVCVSLLVVINLFFTYSSYAEIDWGVAVGIWLLDEGKGDVAKDTSGTGNDGEIQGAQWVDGQFGKALKFDGVSNRVKVPNNNSLELSDAFTVVAWVSVEQFITNAAVVAKGTGSGFWALQVVDIAGGENGWKVRIHDGGNNAQGQNFPNNKTDVWYHLAMVVDGRKGDGLRLYVDGKLKNPVVDNAGVGEIISTEDLYIGWEERNKPFFKGIIDDVAIFNVVLSDDDIASIAKNGLEGAQAVSPSEKIAMTWGNIKRKDSEALSPRVNH